MIDLDKIEILAKRATKGPWSVEWESCDCEYPCSHAPYAIGLSHCCYDDMPDDDFIFIAALNPSVAIKLIDRIRQAEKDAARYLWLRESASTENHGGLAYDFRLVDAIRYMPGASPNETMDIDDAIDEAMQCNKDGE